MDAASNIWRDAFEAFKSTHPAATRGTSAREAAFARFEAHGLPTRRDEYWKYTTVRDVTPESGVVASGASDAFSDVDAYRLVFVDGQLDFSRSDHESLAKVVDLPDASGEWLDRVYAKLQAKPVEGAQKQVERPFADLNMAMSTDPCAIRIPAGTALDKPIHLRYEGNKGAHLRSPVLAH